MPKQSRAPAGLYTASQAIKKLRMPATTFHNYVREGKIKKIVPPGRSEGYYERAYVDEMAKASEMFVLQYAAEPATFSVATPEDAEGIYNVIASLWGTLHTTPVEKRLEWYKVNPAIDYVVKQEGIVTGYITIMPMKHETIEKLMKGQLRGWDIKPEDILPFEPGKPLECYTGAAIRAGVYKPEKYGMRLLIGTMKRLREYAQEGIFIKKMYAVSDTPDGVKLSRDLGFEEQAPAAGSTFNQYVLDMEKSSNPFAKEYIKILKQSQRN